MHKPDINRKARLLQRKQAGQSVMNLHIKASDGCAAAKEEQTKVLDEGGWSVVK
jgi:hypothetical protein